MTQIVKYTSDWTVSDTKLINYYDQNFNDQEYARNKLVRFVILIYNPILIDIKYKQIKNNTRQTNSCTMFENAIFVFVCVCVCEQTHYNSIISSDLTFI